MTTLPFLNVANSATGRRWVGPGPEVERLGLAIAQARDLPRPLQHPGIEIGEVDLVYPGGRRLHPGKAMVA